MNYEQALQYIHSFERFGWDLGLDRLQVLLQQLGNPQDTPPCIHVAGSNGKGSVCNMTANILRQAGYKVGLYTSPFVVDFRDRFQINGEMIAKQTFADYATRVQEAVLAVNAQGIHVTEFEVITALGFLWFAEQQCDFIVLEVGLGGRFDATNCIKSPVLTAITSISLDHVNILGDTIAKIAYEKAGILKDGCVCCVYPQMDVDAMGVLLEQACHTNSRLVQANPNSVTVLQCDATQNRFVYQSNTYQPALLGKHQIYNTLLVLTMVEELQKRGVRIPLSAVQDGIAQTRFAARFEVLNQNPMVVLDGAHNPEGTAGLQDTIQKIDRRKIVLMGMLADKDYAHSIEAIASQADIFYAIPVDSPRALDPADTAKVAAEFCTQVACFTDLDQALTAVADLLKPEDLLLVCGSLYVASEIRPKLLQLIQA